MVKQKKFSDITSPSMFIFLSIVSFGVYEFVWFYRNWKFFKEKEKLDISPFWRAFFAPFFIYKLFQKISVYAKKEGYKGKYSSGWRTFFWWIISLIIFISQHFIALFSIFSFLPLLSLLKAINFYYRKNERNCVPRTIQWWHVLLIIGCLILWILSLLGLFLLKA